VINDHTTGSANQTGYMGLYTYTDDGNYREYVINKFSSHLTAGETYTFSFWASLAPWSRYATHLDAWVGRQANMPTIPGGVFSNNLTFFSVQAGVTMLYPGTGIINNIGSWNQYSFTFTPTQTAEYFLVIGNF